MNNNNSEQEFPTILILSDSGKIAKLFHTNGRLIAEILIHGPLLKVAQNCAESRPILSGRPNVFRAEAFGLAGYEFLDTTNEVVTEKEQNI